MQKQIAKNVGAGPVSAHKIGNTQKGITLIALVITIIVLLILAGVTISMVLGDDGIIAQAQNAKQSQEDAEKDDATKIAIGKAAISDYELQNGKSLSDPEMSGIKSNIEEYNSGKETSDPTYYTYDNTVSTIVEDKIVKGDTEETVQVPIPVGFAHVEGTTVEDGLVVVDGKGNEFVWIPVENLTPYLVSTDGTVDQNTDKIELTSNMQNEYNAMKASVAIYGGFYVGRYETSWTGTEVASRRNVEPMSGTTPIDANIEVFTEPTPEQEAADIDPSSIATGSNWYTFYTKQKELYSADSSSSVVSGMIYHAQWTAILHYLNNDENPVINPNGTKSDRFVFDSTGMGNYSSSLIKTGSNSNYVAKNIYDLAGNYYEWLQAGGFYTDSSGETYWGRVVRGGRYNKSPVSATNFKEYYAWSSSQSANHTGNYRSEYAKYHTSSRLQLYIK